MIVHLLQQRSFKVEYKEKRHITEIVLQIKETQENGKSEDISKKVTITKTRTSTRTSFHKNQTK